MTQPNTEAYETGIQAEALALFNASRCPGVCECQPDMGYWREKVLENRGAVSSLETAKRKRPRFRIDAEAMALFVAENGPITDVSEIPNLGHWRAKAMEARNRNSQLTV